MLTACSCLCYCSCYSHTLFPPFCQSKPYSSTEVQLKSRPFHKDFPSFFRPGFVNLGTTDIWSLIILCVWSCPVHCSMFSRIPGLHPLDVSSTLPRVTAKNVSRHCQMSPGRGRLPLAENRRFRPGVSKLRPLDQKSLPPVFCK